MATEGNLAMVVAGGSATTTTGLVVANTDPIRSFLQSASSNSSDLPTSITTLASSLQSQESIPYRDLRAIWTSSPPSIRPPLTRLFSNATFVFSCPKPRVKCEELKVRLRKLQDLADRKAYRELVKDVAPKEEATEPLSSYKDQIGFGIHVILMMFTGFLAGYAAFRALFNQGLVMNTAGGILGLVCGMLLETVLFVVRTSSSNTASRTAKTLKKQ